MATTDTAEITTLLRLVVLILCAAAGGAQSQAFPSRPVRIVVGFTAGGPTDIVSRLVAQQLTDKFGKPVVVDNRPGATGTIGAELVAKSKPDGYTLYMASQTTHAVAPYMYQKIAYDPVRDFATITLAAQNPLLVVAHPSLGVRSIKDLVALAKSKPGAIDFATGGIGSSPHMSVELFKSLFKLNMVAVHYKGDSAATADLLSGQVPIMFASMVGLLPHVKSGRLRGLAITGAKRSSIAPEFPTIAESGLAGYEVITWFGMLAPTGTPADVIAKLHQDTVVSLGIPQVGEQIAKLGMEIVGSTPDQFGAFLREENVRWSKVVRDLNLRAE
jgi:tripartite-type tricarboxylate transporter receptor subunit TctC